MENNALSEAFHIAYAGARGDVQEAMLYILSQEETPYVIQTIFDLIRRNINNISNPQINSLVTGATVVAKNIIAKGWPHGRHRSVNHITMTLCEQDVSYVVQNVFSFWMELTPALARIFSPALRIIFMTYNSAPEISRIESLISILSADPINGSLALHQAAVSYISALFHAYLYKNTAIKTQATSGYLELFLKFVIPNFPKYLQLAQSGHQTALILLKRINRTIAFIFYPTLPASIVDTTYPNEMLSCLFSCSTLQPVCDTESYWKVHKYVTKLLTRIVSTIALIPSNSKLNDYPIRVSMHHSLIESWYVPFSQVINSYISKVVANGMTPNYEGSIDSVPYYIVVDCIRFYSCSLENPSLIEVYLPPCTALITEVTPLLCQLNEEEYNLYETDPNQYILLHCGDPSSQDKQLNETPRVYILIFIQHCVKSWPQYFLAPVVQTISKLLGGEDYQFYGAINIMSSVLTEEIQIPYETTSLLLTEFESSSVKRSDSPSLILSKIVSISSFYSVWKYLTPGFQDAIIGLIFKGLTSENDPILSTECALAIVNIGELSKKLSNFISDHFNNVLDSILRLLVLTSYSQLGTTIMYMMEQFPSQAENSSSGLLDRFFDSFISLCPQLESDSVTGDSINAVDSILNSIYQLTTLLESRFPLDKACKWISMLRDYARYDRDLEVAAGVNDITTSLIFYCNLPDMYLAEAFSSFMYICKEIPDLFYNYCYVPSIIVYKSPTVMSNALQSFYNFCIDLSGPNEDIDSGIYFDICTSMLGLLETCRDPILAQCVSNYIEYIYDRVSGSESSCLKGLVYTLVILSDAILQRSSSHLRNCLRMICESWKDASIINNTLTLRCIYIAIYMLRKLNLSSDEKKYVDSILSNESGMTSYYNILLENESDEAEEGRDMDRFLSEESTPIFLERFPLAQFSIGNVISQIMQ